VFVITSRQVKALRLRYGTAGNKDDRFDAYVLADVLRTDQRRLTPLTQDGPDTTGLRMLVRARKDLVAARIAAHNQLRSHLLTAFPGAVGLFAALDSPISLTFLTRFPSAQRARWLSEKRLAAWLTSVGYSGRQSAADLMAHLRQAPVGMDGAAAEAVTEQFVLVLRTLRDRIDVLDARIAEALELHADAHIFRSLPRAGTVRAALLLAEIGDARGRFPNRGSTCRGRRRLTLDPRLRPQSCGRLPPRMRQAPPGGAHGFRCRQQASQPLGERHL